MDLLKPPEPITRRTLIVNGDDFGITAGVNAGILHAFREGILTSASLMACGEAFEEAVSGARGAPGLGIGVHLCLTEGKPVSPPNRVSSLLEEDGCFRGEVAAFLGPFFQGKIRLDEVEREVRAQISKVLDHGLRVEKLDSHMHLHMLPPILDVVLRVGLALGITAVRLPRESPRFWGCRPTAWAKCLVLQGLSSAQRAKVRRSGFRVSDHFLGLSSSGDVTEAKLLAWLQALPPGTTELMVHPGYEDVALRDMPASYAYQREREVAALTSSRVRALVEEAGIKLGTFDALSLFP